jgi:creatinine amidohydrolase
MTGIHMHGTQCGIEVAEVAWPEVQRRLAAGATALLPVGAGAKEHGRHLPMNADYLQAKWLVDRLTRLAPVVAWPTVNYGHYPAFVDYPGSCSLSPEVFETMVGQVCADIRRAGARRIVILNTGLSTIAPLQRVCDRDAERVILANVYQGARYRNAAAALRQERRGGHAGELETSMLLAIAPDKVDMSKAEIWDPASIGPGRFYRADPGQPNYSPDGHYGNPSLATAQKGQKLVQAILEDLLEII